MLFAFLIWVIPRSAVVLTVALGQTAFFLLYMPSLWLSLEAGAAAFFKRWWFVPLVDVIVEVWPAAKACLAAGAVAGLLAGVLLAVAVVVTAVPETVPEIARELGVSVEEALYSALLFGAAVGVGFAMFISWLLAALLWWFLEPRIDLPRLLLLATPGYRRLSRPSLPPTKRRGVDHGRRPRRLAGVSETEGKMDTPALTRTCRGQGEILPNAKDFEKKVEVSGRWYAVKVIDGGAEFDKGRSGKPLLRIEIQAEVDGVRSEYTITYGRYGGRQRGSGTRLRQDRRTGRQARGREEDRGAG